jgi:hypothetical protein
MGGGVCFFVFLFLLRGELFVHDDRMEWKGREMHFLRVASDGWMEERRVYIDCLLG